MAPPSLFEECQTVIEKGLGSWKLYFSRWEVLAKYEGEIPESELLSESEEISECGRKKVKKQTHKTKQKPICKKNQKKLTRRKRVPRERERVVSTIQQYKDTNSENLFEDKDNMHMETLLKTVFTDILKANKEDFQVFSILCQTFSSDMTNCLQSFNNQEAFPWSDFPILSQSAHWQNANARSQYLGPNNSNYSGKYCRNQTLFNFNVKTDMGFGEWKDIRNPILDDIFPTLQIPNLSEGQFLFPASGNQSLRQTTQINLGIKDDCPTVLSSLRNGDTKLKSLEWDLSLKSPNSVCRKINKEYFIKRNFLKMNITQDGKRFRNLCLRKRTNSVTLSMENSNFVTPERKPPERKCFSENVLQRKRRCPSKLFFGNEEEDSESDDETEKQTPIIHCKNKKPKTQIISEVDESDSDQCESIFDRVKV